MSTESSGVISRVIHHFCGPSDLRRGDRVIAAVSLLTFYGCAVPVALMGYTLGRVVLTPESGYAQTILEAVAPWRIGAALTGWLVVAWMMHWAHFHSLRDTT